ncbi:deoxyribose-phosphate aldolase [Tetragenococcus koreensis]|uniref:Deoxyribose-phosphate aldolase n=1 Tax=Tetragenococcus koreensis TaxID=290335 RepID=A0AAN4ZQR5_9ENTE|nr:deoxyribose-phosphate aldolase [Tetragenococcus koreensis]GEQ50138.1 deoxyribose-phosphate aldolase [Tetragenococcus koreensis]GEQ52611.1 deoxyribose-phosphate aldolase [Tetragenococcus koreensis]GEQ55146.1 deoxyribose-phosphate aldolase [Tetragenococcus koreensis]GEQ57612.1 deoxyribose-phosphate aldolase [Tetragenococcus koreensis]GEQ60152.1 deoxyribose-phosphate aldolase [Tetragenococcus koreensis]
MNRTVKRFKAGDKITIEELAYTLDHSLLNPSITVDQLKDGCKLARENDCVSVCVRPSDLPIVVEELAETDVLPTTVIGFPHGTATTESKVFETKDAIKKGAVEVDMVMNFARFLSGEYDYVEDEIKQVVDVSHESDVKVKVIFENHYLTTEQIKKACQIAEKAGADFVKTSTGYAPSGAKIEDLNTMRENVSDNVEVKAAGGVRDLDQALEVLGTGTVRIGTSGSKKILEDAKDRLKEGKLVIPDESV